MDEDSVREHAEEFCAALVAGDIDRAIQSLSPQLRGNVGEVVALLPLPATEATIESVEHSGSGDNVALRVVGEAEVTIIQTRWKNRDGRPTIIEVSHMSQTSVAESPGDIDDEMGSELAG